jgi:hypothetical protein
MIMDILSKFDFKNNLFPIGVFVALFIGSYILGLNHGHVSRETLCKDDIIKLNQCKDDIETQQKEHLDSTSKYISDCKVKTCKSLCNEQVKKAVEDFKLLQHKFECED